MKLDFKGLMAPVFTAFNRDCTKSINVDVIPQYSKYLKENNIYGILVNGTSGEGMCMTVTERKRLAEAWLSATDSSQHVMIQVGGAPLPDVVELAKHAEHLGANSLLCLPDLYFKPQNENQLIDYLKTVSDAAPNTPLLYYHIPMFTNVNIHMGKFLNQIGDKIPTFAGIKFTSNDLDEGMQALNACNQGFSVFLGADTLMFPAQTIGFDSFIMTTLSVYPDLAYKILKGEAPKESQQKLSQKIAKIVKYGSWVPTMKTAMNIINKQFDFGEVRQPLISLKPEEVGNMKMEIFACKG